MYSKKLPTEFISPQEAALTIGCGAREIKRAMRHGTFPVENAIYFDVKWAYLIPRQEFYKAFRPDLAKENDAK